MDMVRRKLVLVTIGTLRVKWFRNNAHTVHLMHSVALKDYMYNNVHVLVVSKGQTRFGDSLGHSYWRRLVMKSGKHQ